MWISLRVLSNLHISLNLYLLLCKCRAQVVTLWHWCSHVSWLNTTNYAMDNCSWVTCWTHIGGLSAHQKVDVLLPSPPGWILKCPLAAQDSCSNSVWLATICMNGWMWQAFYCCVLSVEVLCIESLIRLERCTVQLPCLTCFHQVVWGIQEPDELNSRTWNLSLSPK